MSTVSESAQLPRCPQCDEPFRPESAFCGNCGASLAGASTDDAMGNPADTQATATFAPLPDYTGQYDYDVVRDPSPWAPPGSSDYTSPPVFDGAATSGGNHQTKLTDARSASIGPSQQQQGIRGLFLGILAMILIGAVLALYLYDAWLSDSARTTVEGWLPWLD